MQIELASVRIDGGTQPRARIDENLVSEYAAAMQAGESFPAVVVFRDGVDTWLADGFHRFHAARKSGATSILASVRTGTLRDAILFSVGANSDHGLRRTNEDKRRSVMTLLNDAEWAKWSDREIARRCGVSDVLVASHRPKPSLQESCSDRTYTTKHGTTATMKTSNIGKRATVTNSLGRVVQLKEGDQPRDVRASQIRELAAEGNSAEQIADLLDINAAYVREFASKEGIVLYHKITGRTAKIDNRRVIEQTVLGLEASAASLHTIGISLSGITPEEASDWVVSLSESIRAFSALKKKLQEHCNAKDAA